MKLIIWLSFIGLLFTACNNEIRSEREFHNWLSEESNGLVCSRKINDFLLTVKYLPKEYLILKELRSSQNFDQSVIDSLNTQHEPGMAFLLTIKIDQQGRDVMYEGVSNYLDYKRRVIDLNFDIGEYIYLQTPAGKFKPILSTLENSYSLAEHRNVFLLFGDTQNTLELQNQEELDFVFEDEIFGTGINHFIFKQKDWQNIPPINYSNILSKDFNN